MWRRGDGGRARRAAAAALALLLGTGAPGIAWAQISPGPLSRAHADFEGVKNCLKCHGLKEKTVDPQCLACHAEVARLREEGRGLHAREGKGACADCHVEHGGTDFDIVSWEGEESFDHVRSGWALDGKHAAAECRKCHRKDLRVSPVAALRDGGLPDDTWLGLDTACLSCHADPHTGRFGTSCTDCHGTADWKRIAAGAFDHEKTRYPLRGRHVAVACVSCHRNGYGEMPRFAECRDCHQDPHRGEATLAGAAADCASCHRVEGFVPSTFDVARHAKTRYPLEGRHAGVECASCHRKGEAPGGLRFRPASAKCTDCHADAHAGQLAARADGGRCESCHDLARFRPSRFTVADHAGSRFPLQGAHEKAACASCHGPERTNLAPVPGPKVTGNAGVLFRLTESQCVACHHDPHGGRLGATDDKCLGCHDASRFRPSTMDVAAHARTEFPLAGAHAAVPCFECHKELVAPRPATTLAGTAARWPAMTFETAKRCRDCHADPHGGQFDRREGGGECAACHDADAFRPAGRFDHERDSAFALAGAHAKVVCSACHGEGPLPDGRRGAVYRSTPRACEACHLPGAPGRGTP